MNDPRDSLEDLGRSIRRARGALVDELGVVSEVERRLAKRERAGARRLAPLAFAAVAAAASLILWSWPRPPLSFVLDDDAGVAGRWIEPSDEDMAAVFSDGTTVLFTAGARARVEQLDADGAQVQVERGRVVASVRHAPDTQWLFEVGPYSVEVTGTRFEASWDAVDERFSITMLEGTVRVSGPDMPTPRSLVAGQTLELGEALRAATADDVTSAARGRDVIREPTSEPEPERPSVGTSSSEADGARPARTSPPTRSSRSSSQPSWSAFADEGDYQTALSTAEAAGFTQLLDTLSAGELLRLGDVARYAGARPRAREAYQAVRDRFGGTSFAAAAAYSLGATTSDPASSREWYETYLREAPRGPLAAEALGRLLEAARDAPDARARAHAATYLERFPDGPHARLAQTLSAP